LSRHAIFCLWHESWWSYFVAFLGYRSAHVMMSHPAAYMKPAHNVFRLMGVKRLLLGSSGEEGRNAANTLARLVREGHSTTISPDGPYGPARILKKGVLHVARQSGAPIVPLTISSSRYLPWRSWDSKKFPLPFNRIRVTVHEDIRVNDDNFDEAMVRLAFALGAPIGRADLTPERTAAFAAGSGSAGSSVRGHEMLPVAAMAQRSQVRSL
jgi:lysophospholipid acyltransferase (LPLAT)-like uncharacterized protein